jgi:hypothetical protein
MNTALDRDFWLADHRCDELHRRCFTPPPDGHPSVFGLCGCRGFHRPVSVRPKGGSEPGARCGADNWACGGL